MRLEKTVLVVGNSLTQLTEILGRMAKESEVLVPPTIDSVTLPSWQEQKAKRETPKHDARQLGRQNNYRPIPRPNYESTHYLARYG